MHVFFAFLFYLASAATSPLTLTPVEVPKYESVKGIARYATPEEYDAAQRDTRFSFSRVAYESDGLTVYAYVYAPKSAKGRLPVIVFNRGSYTWKEFAGEYLLTFHRLAEAGFLVVAPMYRGSGGSEGRDELGGADLADLMNTTALMARLPNADASNVFLYGESRGGMMVYQAVRDRYPARAAAVYGAFADLRELAAPGGRFEKMAPAIWPDYATKHAEIDERRSALRWPERLDVPLLIMHGGADRDVPPAQSLALAAKLESLGKPYELVIRAEGNHTLFAWREARDAAAVDWFRRHLVRSSPH